MIVDFDWLIMIVSRYTSYFHMGMHTLCPNIRRITKLTYVNIRTCIYYNNHWQLELIRNYEEVTDDIPVHVLMCSTVKYLTEYYSFSYNITTNDWEMNMRHKTSLLVHVCAFLFLPVSMESQRWHIKHLKWPTRQTDILQQSTWFIITCMFP